MESDYQFSVGDMVLAYYGEVLYEAKCLKRRFTDAGDIEYYIHYKGFSNKWDEWVDEDEVLEINKINLGHKERLEERLEIKLSELKKSKKQNTSTKKIKTTESSSEIDSPSLIGVKRKRGRPKKIVNVPHTNTFGNETLEKINDINIITVSKCAHDNSSNETIQKVNTQELQVHKEAKSLDADPVVDQTLENDLQETVEQAIDHILEHATVPTLEEAAEDEAAVRAVANIVLTIVPYSLRLQKELSCLKISPILQKTIDLDISMHNEHQKVLKFPEDCFMANVLQDFIQSTFFKEKFQDNDTTVITVALLEYFNLHVHQKLIYTVEKRFSIQNKGMEYFRQRCKDQPNLTYIFKNEIKPKKVWCYLYGPVYLLRLLVNLPKLVISNTLEPQCELKFFINYIEELLRFLEDNHDTYFSVNDYIKIQ